MPDQRPSSLPLPPTPLVGREREVAAVRARLLDPAVHLLTLTGTGDGKTRLAIAVAEGLAGDFPEGVAFVSLAALSNPGFVPSSVAQSLGVRESAAGRA